MNCGSSSETVPSWVPDTKIDEASEKPADIFSLAMLMSELITGEAPYAHLDNTVQITHAIVNDGERPELPSPDASDVSACAVVELIKAAWAEEPSARPIAAQMLEDIEEAAENYQVGRCGMVVGVVEVG